MKTELIILIGLVMLIILYFVYRFFFPSSQEKLKNINENEDSKKNTNNFDNNKKIQYFGGDYCPFSNVDSNAYKIIKDFENQYGDKVSVNYFWSGKDTELMKSLDIKYVPTILNGNNELIELKLPEDVDTTNLTNEELKSMLLENIYNKL